MFGKSTPKAVVAPKVEPLPPSSPPNTHGPQLLKELRTKLNAQSLAEMPTGTTHSHSAPSSTKNALSFLQGNGLSADLRAKLGKGSSAPTKTTPTSSPATSSPKTSPPTSPVPVRKGSQIRPIPKITASTSLGSLPIKLPNFEPTAREMSLKTMLNMSNRSVSAGSSPTSSSTLSAPSIQISSSAPSCATSSTPSTNEAWSDSDLELEAINSVSVPVGEDETEDRQSPLFPPLNEEAPTPAVVVGRRPPAKSFTFRSVSKSDTATSKETEKERQKDNEKEKDKETEHKEPRMKKTLSLKNMSLALTNNKQKNPMQISLAALNARPTSPTTLSSPPQSPTVASPSSLSPQISPRETSGYTSPNMRREKGGSMISPAAPLSPSVQRTIIFSDVLTQELRKAITKHPCVDLSSSDSSGGTLRGASFYKLVEWLLVVSDDPDESDIKAFLCLYRTYKEPKELFDAIRRFWKIYCSTKHPEYKVVKIIESRMKRRVFNFIRTWLENWFELDLEKSLVTKIVRFVDNNFPSEEGSIFKLLVVKKNFEKQGTTGSKKPKLQRLSDEVIKDDSIWLLEHSSKEIAEHMTYLDVRSYQNIKPYELLNCSWTKEGAAPNIQTAVERFNTVSNWVPTVILGTNSPEKQAMVIKKFLAIAKRLWEIKNWNGLMQIIAGLGNCAVTRLKQPQRLISPKIKEVWLKLDQLLNPAANYRTYRILVKETPCVPIIAILQRDLTFMYDGNPDYLRGDILNYEKMKMIGAAILDFITHCQRNMPGGYPIKKRLKTLLKYPHVLDSEQVLFV
eukprot:TRINITY_DN8660_c0_g1_i3.p1 TRINITY_DN8660_c0_g1~~TRINITY_DN8660_c0_g1_i3.p1  ORF type:complete len:793 (-),score=146.15 TRINITY_DN8660_c0_g1_i3:575-2953(-)